jgi:hypothetical protein
MTRAFKLDSQTVEQLAKRFVDLALIQYDADLDGNIKKYNAHFRKMAEVTEELKRRPGDQRTALLSLYQHPNPEVRLMAAKNTLAVAPTAARRLLETLAKSKEGGQSGDAGMCLVFLDRGIFKPT